MVYHSEFDLDFYELSPYGPLLFDDYCGEPVAWGFRIKKYLGEERFAKLSCFGQIRFVDFGAWVLIVKRLTLKEAISKYGPITHSEDRSITFGNKKFLSTIFESS